MKYKVGLLIVGNFALLLLSSTVNALEISGGPGEVYDFIINHSFL